MDSSKQMRSPPSPPSSSFSDLFGSNGSLPSSAGGFASLFPPPSSVPRRNLSSEEFMAPLHKQSSGGQAWSGKHGTSDNVSKDAENASDSTVIKERRIFQEREEPCPLSSSLYYGGQEDMYIKSSDDRTSQPYSKLKKVDGRDDPDGNHLHSASRGNWWQGSLYY